MTNCLFLLWPFSASVSQDLSFAGYHRDDFGKVLVGDDSLNGVELGPVAEVTKGWKAEDRLAVFVEGSGTDTLSFLYIVQKVGRRL